MSEARTSMSAMSDALRRELRINELEARLVQLLPTIDQHEIVRPVEPPKQLERVAGVKLDEVFQCDAAKFCRRILDLGRRELEAVNLATCLTNGISQPDRRIAIRSAYLDDALSVE